MSRQEFINALRSSLSDLPKRELDDRLSFYNEMIDDRVEDGLSEEAAISEIGSVELVAAGIREELSGDACDNGEEAVLDAAELDFDKNESDNKLARRIIFWAGSPVWLAVAVSLLAATAALYASVWAVIVSLWAVFSVCTLTAPTLIVLSVINIISGGSTATVMIAAALVSAGFAIFLFFGSLYATKSSVELTKRCVCYFKSLHKRKEIT